MFDLIKQQVNLIELLEKDLSVTFKQSGDKNWIIDGDKDVESCPFCGHHGCFKVHHVEGDNSSSFYKCFSCGAFGDVITWKAKESKLKNGEAARALAQEYDIKLPYDYSPVQQVFNLAAEYYHTSLLETCNKPYPVLNGLTPLRYQTEKRGHKLETLSKFKVGFSDGNLAEYLDSLGIDKEILEGSGLINVKTGKDFLPTHCFIYPHFVRGKVSHFTFKDPLKRIQFQLPKRYSLNGYLFYNQDVGTSNATTSIALVEGENDLLSVVENGGLNTMAIIGQISGEQLDWLRMNCKEKQILTIFDPDDAGDKYREKVELLRRFFKGLVHVRPADGKDIDEHLIAGADLADIVLRDQVKVVIRPPERKLGEVMPWDNILKTSPEAGSLTDSTKVVRVVEPLEAPNPTLGPTLPTEEKTRQDDPLNASMDLGGGMTVVGPATEAEKYSPPQIPTDFLNTGQEVANSGSEIVQIDDSAVIQMKNCYYKVVYKEGIPSYIRISDFTLELKNIILDEETNDRIRELIIRRQDGYRSDVFELDSSTKINNAKFKEKMAQMADCEWMGKENDLDGMWRLIYSQYPEVFIRLVRHVGRHEKYKCWIFNNVLITDSGSEIFPDDNGVFWVSGKSNGIKIKDIILDDGEGSTGVPSIRMDLPREKTDEVLASIVRHLSVNFKEIGPVLIILGWVHANLYSNDIHKADGGFGSLMLWGVNGKGKSTIAHWLQDFYGFTNQTGSTSVPQLKQAVGFQRKGAFYASLPLMLDEVKADEETNKHLGMIRGWYDRSPRAIAQKNGGAVKNLPVRSCLLMAGEDLPADPATRERCIMLRVPDVDPKREDMQLSYTTMNENREYFSNIMYHWLRDSITIDKKAILNGIRELDKALVRAGCSNRISKVWASAGYFASLIAEKHCPDFDFVEFIRTACVQEQKQQREANTLNNFYNAIATLHARENGGLTDQHIFRSGNFLHIWFAATFNEIKERLRMDAENKWSKHSILRTIKEEPYFICDDKKINMGLSGARKVVLTLDLSKCPDILKNLVDYRDPEESEEVKEKT